MGPVEPTHRGEAAMNGVPEWYDHPAQANYGDSEPRSAQNDGHLILVGGGAGGLRPTLRQKREGWGTRGGGVVRPHISEARCRVPLHPAQE